MRKTAVVILNYNGKKFLQEFLPGVLLYSQIEAEVIVADNCSTDDSVEFIRQYHPNVRVIQNKSNGGFAKGYNEALSQINADYYVLLNSDVEVTPNWIAPVIELMNNDNTIAACQPKILAFHNKVQFEYAGAAGGFIDKYGYPFCRGRIFDTFEADLGQYQDTTEVHWATGACLFVRSAAYHAIGGLDEDFFAHMEEIDLCWRLKNLGHKIMYTSGATVFHVGAGTLAKHNPRKTYLNFRNNLILLCKNHAHQFFWIKLLLRMTMDGIAGLKFLFSGDVLHFVAVIHAHLSFYKSFPSTLQKRNQFKRQVQNWSKSAIYDQSIVIDYFIKGKSKFSELPKNKFIK